MKSHERKTGAFWNQVEKTLQRMGFDLDQLVAGGDQVKCIVVTPDLRGSLHDLSRAPRDHVVMVRLDETAVIELDAWVESGAVKSRSEGAALFIREGLKLYRGELDKLEGPLKDVQSARQRLEERVKEVFGDKEGTDST